MKDQEIIKAFRELKELLGKAFRPIRAFICSHIIILIICVIIILFITVTISQESKHKALEKEYAHLLKKKNPKPNKTKDMEFAYMEGQIDYMHGDIRIEKQEGDYIYIISPWNGGTEPYFWKHSEYKNDRAW